MLEKIILIDRKAELINAWVRMFANCSDITVVQGDYRTFPDAYDCVVAPGNSFGLMDGGFDEIIAEKFPHAVTHIGEMIRETWYGEQPVGTCLLGWTKDIRHPHVAHAPTMRVPMSIATTDNVYLAMRAVLLEVSRHNSFFADEHNPPIRTLLIPGLGAGTGHVPPLEVARQMGLAYQSVRQPLPDVIDWAFADARQNALGPTRGGDVS